MQENKLGDFPPENNFENFSSHYTLLSVIGTGTFGVIYKAMTNGAKEKVAVKKVLLDKNYENRELGMLRQISHENLIHLKEYFIDKKPEEIFLYYITDYQPDNLLRYLEHRVRTQQWLSLEEIRKISHQILKGVEYLHSLGICHRDMKPQNILINPENLHVEICDLGSAKKLISSQENVTNICQKNYRAPELLLGNKKYTEKIDIWSVGCIICEIIIGRKIFNGESTEDLLNSIISILGPIPEELKSSLQTEALSKSTGSSTLEEVLKSNSSEIIIKENFLNLIESMLEFLPSKRLSARELLDNSFFRE